MTMLHRLSFTILGACAVVLATTMPAAADSAERMLQATGEATLSITTDRATISLAIDDRGEDAAALQASIAERTAAVLAVLAHDAVDHVETSGIQLMPDHRDRDGELIPAGYRASNRLRVEVRNHALGATLDAAVGAGVTRIDGIRFSADPERFADAATQVLHAAVDDALRQATSVLEHLGLGPGEIVDIRIDQAPHAADVRLDSNGPMLMRSATTPVVPGEQTLRARISLRLAY